MKKYSLFVVVVLLLSLVSPVSGNQKEWTFFVFLNADNNLDPFGVGDMQEMAKVGSNDFMNIVVLIDREKGPATLNFIEKGNIKVIKDCGEVDMGDYKFLISSFKEVAAAYPAQKYALVIWNHGSGWKNASNNVIKGISYDDSTGNHITTEQLGIAIREIKEYLGRNLEVLCLDACLMQMMEVVYAVKDHCDYVMASEEVEPGEGYPYDEILGAIKKGTTPLEFVKIGVAKYTASYTNGSQGNSSCTQSAIDCKKVGTLKDAIDGFAKASMAGNFAPKFKEALAKVQKFYYRTNIDLLHFVTLLKGMINEEGFQTAAKKLESACAAAIVANATNGYNMANAKGIAIYFPSASYSFSNLYNELAFAKESLWDEMIQDYYKKSTTATIIGDIENNNLSSLIDYVRTANENNREVSKYLITKLNFRVFSEGGFSHSIQDSVSNLINELKYK